MPSLLLIDDDISLSTAVAAYLEAAKFTVDLVHTAEEGLKKLTKHHYDMVLLDLTLPDEDGLCLLRKFRHSSDVPVMIISGRDSTEDRIAGLELGGDDYLIKPFSPKELVLRINKRLEYSRAAEPKAISQYQFGEWTFTPDTYELIHAKNGTAQLTPREFTILKVLCAKAPRPCNRDELVDAFDSLEGPESSRAVDMVIKRLRSKVESCPSNPLHILTIKGFGYRIDLQSL